MCAGDQLWETPQTCSIAKVVSPNTPNSEPITSMPGKHKIEKTEIGGLVIRKELLELYMNGMGRQGTYDNTILDSLLIGGSYKEGGRVWLSMGHEGATDAHVVIPNDRVVERELHNPMYRDTSDLDAFMSDTELLPDDIVWPRNRKKCVFTDSSNLEDAIVKQRHEQNFSSVIREAWLPSRTAYTGRDEAV